MLRLKRLVVHAGCRGRRRCDTTGPGPGGGRPCRVEHHDGDVERCHDEVRGAVHTGGQRHGEHHHQGRAPYDHDENGHQRRGDVELKDDATPDLVDGAGLVDVEVVDVDDEEREAGPGCGELGL